MLTASLALHGCGDKDADATGGDDWANPTCPIDDVTGWPQMYLACGSGDGVHWIRQSGGMYFHQRTNNGGTSNNELATIWVR
jgi:hypothetical protein